MSKRIVIVDDQDKILKSLARNLTRLGYLVDCTQSSQETLNVCKNNIPDLVLLDVMLGSESGIDLLSKLKVLYPDIPIIMITGHGTIERAVEALKRGACDFLEKPLLFNKLLITIERIFELEDVKKENSTYKDINCAKFITGDKATQELVERAKRIAATEIPILIYGESGTGKEVLTQELHASSRRSSAPLVQINCAAIPANLLDNELFGHKKGAFTGAISDYSGVFEKASGGTLHLDEIADMSLETQSKILRVLESGEYKRIGEQLVRHANIRFIASTNIDLNERVRENRFRQDLLFRLNAAVIRIPALRERKGDIMLIAQHFLDKKAILLSRKLYLSNEVEELFKNYSWCGNVRELRNTIDYASAVCRGDTIELNDLPEGLSSGQTNCESPKNKETTSTSITTRITRNGKSEKESIIAALHEAKFNKKRAAEILSISRRSLYNKIAKHSIEV